MIELKDAMKIAKEFIIEINGEQEDFQLEEITMSNDKRNYEVTYSYNKKIDNPNQLQLALGLDARKAYKRVVIDRESKEVVGMYNWAYKNREAA